jgi:hypothetical protein
MARQSEEKPCGGIAKTPAYGSSQAILGLSLAFRRTLLSISIAPWISASKVFSKAGRAILSANPR